MDSGVRGVGSGDSQRDVEELAGAEELAGVEELAGEEDIAGVVAIASVGVNIKTVIIYYSCYA